MRRNESWKAYDDNNAGLNDTDDDVTDDADSCVAEFYRLIVLVVIIFIFLQIMGGKRVFILTDCNIGFF